MKNIQVWGHRGASGCRPENTLASFEEAVNEKADGVELDIQLTKDGQIVVCHDETIDRTSSGKGYLKDYTLDQLRRLNFNQQFADQPNAEIPTMAEVFDLLKPTNLIINIELKTGVFDYEGIEEKIIQLTHAKGFEDRVIYSSFNHYSIKRIQKLDPHAKTAFLYEDGSLDMPAYGLKNGVTALHPWIYNLRYPDFMEQCHKNGIAVNVWTVNTAQQIKYCADMGVDAVIGNYPSLSREVLGK